MNWQDKENKRVSYEWEAFLKKYGPISHYDELSEEGKKAACDLAEKQGERSANQWGKRAESNLS